MHNLSNNMKTATHENNEVQEKAMSVQCAHFWHCYGKYNVEVIFFFEQKQGKAR